MTHSMTGFGQSQSNTDSSTLVIEIRSVNHRHLEISMRLPEALGALEVNLRNRIKQCLSRGKIDVHIRLQQSDEKPQTAGINERHLELILARLRHIQNAGGDLVSPASAAEIMRIEGIIEHQAIDLTTLGAAVQTTFETALEQLQMSRAGEGLALKKTVLSRVSDITAQLEQIKTVFPMAKQGFEDRLRSKLAELSVDIDEQRLAQEIILFTQKADIDEELDRLEVHLREIKAILETVGPCGRKLDFLMQELNREANTIASKSIHTDITKASVEMKVLIEQMREQIQNIE